MAHHKSAQKRIRQARRRNATNTSRESRIKTFVKQVEQAVAAGDQSKAQAALRSAEPELMRGVSKGVVDKNTASRRVSRLSKRIKAMSA